MMKSTYVVNQFISLAAFAFIAWLTLPLFCWFIFAIVDYVSGKNITTISEVYQLYFDLMYLFKK